MALRPFANLEEHVFSMQFLSNGPNIPADLVALQERGQTLFVCGAGVSRTIDMPLFRELVEGVYQNLGEDWKLHAAEHEAMQRREFDRVLRCLERRLAASDLPRNQGMRGRIRSAVRTMLSPPNDPDYSNHRALLDLSRNGEGQTRLLTTNFDTVFERAWYEHHGDRIPSHAGPAMPQPMVSSFLGVLHLHGRLADDRIVLDLHDTDLVLTSAEFGDAYLRSGWASRYVYDIARTHTLVLVGYQADDPPMRYLLEVLEADRDRYPDLNQVYAFASYPPGNEETTQANWEAKGVKPILYEAEKDDHSPLYQTLREWRQYADDPTAWRRNRLRVILNKLPATATERETSECMELLSHGDAARLLGEISPDATWFPIFVERRIIADGSARGSEWIAKRINDPRMIKACAALPIFDAQTHWRINHALERERQNLSPVLLDAWKLMLDAKLSTTPYEFDDKWYDAAKAIKRGEAGYRFSKLVANILRPRLHVTRPFYWPEGKEDDEPDVRYKLISIDFRSADDPSPDEILKIWPDSLGNEVALFRVLERALVDALEEAREIGFLERPDRASGDVPSVALHQQNEYRTGFYPITRVLADIWQRIAAHDRDEARTLVKSWSESQYLLLQRLYLFTRASRDIFTNDEVSASILALNADIFWLSGAQVEIMRLLIDRWHHFSKQDREAIESRLQAGMPKELFPTGAFESEEEWESIRDARIFRRLSRIAASGGELSAESLAQINEIALRHPRWQPRPGDRDDFDAWHETRHGPDGHPELLAHIADDALVKEAMRLQRENEFEERDIWRLFCSADPDRALRGLRLAADAGQWEPEAWQRLLWAAGDNGMAEFHYELGEQLVRMPDEHLTKLLSSAASWLQRRREILTTVDPLGGLLLFRIWDRFADLTYVDDAIDKAENDNELADRALNEPGGILAWVLLEMLSASNPKAGSGFGPDLLPRFDRIATALGQAGDYGRIYLARFLSYLDKIDPTWTGHNFALRLTWNHREARALWHANADDRPGSAQLFNSLKPALLEAFRLRDLSDHDFGNLAGRLIQVGIWKQQGNAGGYNLSFQEIKQTLTVGPPAVRQHVSWNFWRMAASDDGNPPDKAQRWLTLIGPIFRGIWPLDAGLRTGETAHNLVLMALECDAAFPDAVDAIIDFVVPFQIYQLSGLLRLEPQHDMLVRNHPIALVKLINALIDPAVHPVPDDLGTLLDECAATDITVKQHPSYIRLFGLSRQRGA